MNGFANSEDHRRQSRRSLSRTWIFIVKGIIVESTCTRPSRWTPSFSFPSFILPHIVEINVLWCGALLTALLPLGAEWAAAPPIMTKAE